MRDCAVAPAAGTSAPPCRHSMYIVAIAWLYVVLMMSLTEQSWIAGIGTFILYGVAPLSLFLWLAGTPARKRRRKEQERQAAGQSAHGNPHGGDGPP
ncbi:hypothetical protein HI806_08960 [Ralstonia solanacearum]|nr:hypothetical protein [Ralstonia pseudosolanacearum]QIK18458.1 hypothetical protein G7968_08495 [Ralstonia solanacearum]CAD15332.1 probable transmembrane protein [Ralstonia pseudosolanacearum GMI1000]MCK4117996.1 hypothetical protein [Ralstonia pseudosolanacearum]MCK4121222.1 hypothetical protein [Ralstonia pseudosolanacearum]